MSTLSASGRFYFLPRKRYRFSVKNVGNAAENLQIIAEITFNLESLVKHFFSIKRYGFPRKNLWWLFVLWFWLFSELPTQAQAFKFTSGRKKQTLRFQLHRNLMIVEAKLNGKGPYNFLLDTGVNTSIITDAGLQDSVRFSRGPALRIAGVGEGSDLHAFYTPDLKVELPGIVSENLTFAVLSEDILNLGSYVGIPVAGILGYDFFNSFVVEANFSTLKLKLFEPETYKPERNYEVLPLSLEGNKPYLQTEIQVQNENVPVRLLVDTGAGFALSLETASDPRLKLPAKTLRAQLGIGLAGTVNGYLVRIEKLRLGKYLVPHLLSSFPDSVALLGKTSVKRNGTLGLELLKRFAVVFDYPHQKLCLKQRIPLDKPFEYDLCGLDLVAVAPDFRTYRVTGVHENSAAAEAGILAGDELLTLDMMPVSQLNLTQISRIFHSYPGRKITLLLKREGQLVYAEVILKRRI
ncbi:aspartyl protease family protein [Adhaeribacter terreus]|uniref:Aspartyl protease family protein n=1 Tax=Adhaeribacter terreus TaxID=529703 RepID=A0ABW0EBW3_9BACT